MAAQPDTPGDRSPLRPDHAYGRLPPAAGRLFRLLAAQTGPDVSAHAVAALADLPVSDAEEALRLLATAGLLTVVSDGMERWMVSPDARHYAQELSDPLADADGREEALHRLIDYYVITAEVADEYLRGLPHVLVISTAEFADRSGALAWLDAEWLCLVATVRLAAAMGRDEAAESLPLLVAQFLGFRRRFDELIAVTEIGLAAARRLGDQAAEGELLTNLGLAWSGIRQFRVAAQAHREALAIFRGTGDRQREGDIMNNLGLALHGLDQDDDAVRAHLEAAAIFREMGDRQGEGKAINNLGLALRGLGQNDDAVSAHREAADIFHAANCRHEEANALANLGTVLNAAGLRERATAAYQGAAEIFRETGDYPAEFTVRQILQVTQETT